MYALGRLEGVRVTSLAARRMRQIVESAGTCSFASPRCQAIEAVPASRPIANGQGDFLLLVFGPIESGGDPIKEYAFGNLKGA